MLYSEQQINPVRHMYYVTVFVLLCFFNFRPVVKNWTPSEKQPSTSGVASYGVFEIHLTFSGFAYGGLLRESRGRRQVNHKRKRRLRQRRKLELLSTSKAYRDWEEAKMHFATQNEEPCFTEILSEEKSAKRFQEYNQESNEPHPQKRGRAKRDLSNRETSDDVTSSSLYLSGRGALSSSLANASCLMEGDGVLSAFTIETWVKSDGGQKNPATVVELYGYHCGDASRKTRLWTLGLKDQNFGTYPCSVTYVKMYSHNGRFSTYLTAPFCLKMDTWTHIAATYDGLSLRLLVNGITVSAAPGEIVTSMESQLDNATTCLQLTVGCRLDGSHCYRGLIDNLRLSNASKSQQLVKQGMHSTTADSFTIVMKTFSEFGSAEWDVTPDSVIKGFLNHDNAPIARQYRYHSVMAPPCGKTVCDNPEVALTYATLWSLRRPKTVRYRLVNVSNDDGSNPMISAEETTRQHNYLNSIFERYNITWLKEVVHVTNTSLRRKTIECDSNEAGSVKADLSVTEYKKTLNVDNKHYLSVFFANWTNPNSIGMATFPWDKEVFTVQGGTVVQLKPYEGASEMAGIIHEFGHNLGLLHVHHGLRRDVNCNSDCVEMEPSMLKGDLCLDTNPTPINTLCNDPVTNHDHCGYAHFSNTPYSNFMSYADGSCQDTFTRQQTGRMHCYLDLIYFNWREDEKMPIIPLPPRIVSSAIYNRSVFVAWLPPIGFESRGGSGCDVRCDAEKSLKQYARTAISPVLDSQQSPDQATGPPDQEACSMRGMNFWMALDQTQNMMLCDKRCYIEFTFETSVVPHQIRLWVTYGTETMASIREIEIRHTDETVTSLGAHAAKCGEPLTIRTNIDVEIISIRVYVRHTYTAVDAIEITSRQNHPLCNSCSDISYRIRREPRFEGAFPAEYLTTEELFFADSKLEDGTKYTYSVQPVDGNVIGDATSPVTYFLGQSTCGDGLIQCGDEECDDGNQVNEDGCSSTCTLEDGFICTGQPSDCHVISEVLITDVRHNDVACSPMTLQDYIDQWASRVQIYTSPQVDQIDDVTSLRMSCSDPNVTVTGTPDAMTSQSEIFCDTLVDSSRTWMPCSHGDFSGLKVSFSKAVVPSSILIYSPDRSIAISDFPITLYDTLGQSHLIQSEARKLGWCSGHVVQWIPDKIRADNVGPVKQIVLGNWSGKMAIDAVALRSPSHDETIKDFFFTTNTVHANEPAVTVITTNDCLDCDAKPDATQGAAMNLFNNSCILTNPNQTVLECQTNGVKTIGSSVVDGTVCSVVCMDGWRPVGADKVICVNGEWLGNISCRPVTCSPVEISESVTCSNGRYYQSVCNFTCSDGVHTSQMKCSNSGEWKTIGAGCQATCSSPPNLPHAVMSRCVTSQQGYFLPHQICRYRCIVGYHVMQQRRRSFRMTCSDDGNWSGPRCEPVMCDEVDDLASEVYNCTDGRYPGSVCGCAGSAVDYSVVNTMTCNELGQWRGILPSCASHPGECGHPKQSHDLEFECNGYTVGKTCTATCTVPHHDVVISAPVQSNKSTDPRDQIDPVKKRRILVCAGHGRWFPEPNSISCVSECNTEDMGDGWCDPDNNRAHCNWDNGDCCASTTSSGKVEPFPATCTKRCECKDPNSIEFRESATIRQVHKGEARALNRRAHRRRSNRLPTSLPINQERKLKGNRRRQRKDSADFLRVRGGRSRRIRPRRLPMSEV